MKPRRPSLLARVVLGALGACVAAAALLAADRSAPPRLSSAPGNAFTESERGAIVAWAMARPEVKAAVAGHRTRLLRVWSDVAKGAQGAYRRATLLLRDYDAGTARQIEIDLATGRIETRELVGVQPSPEEIEEGMAIVRSDPALAAFVANPKLELLGGFHNRSRRADDPCARNVCLDFAFMRPSYEGPARYVIVDLTRRVVANRDFRARPGEAMPRMTKKVPK